MKSHVSRPFLREIEKEFNRVYPYVRIEFPKNGGVLPDAGINDPGNSALGEKARELLLHEAGLADGMTVKELENTLMALLALPVQIFRKSGKMWIETKMTREWTLKQQNDRGRELAPGEEG
jgi:hypothetical protein